MERPERSVHIDTRLEPEFLDFRLADWRLEQVWIGATGVEAVS